MKLKKAEAGQVIVRNDWNEPVTLVISGVTYTLPAGESRTLAAPPGSSPYEMVAGPHRLKGTIEAGRSYQIKPPVP